MSFNLDFKKLDSFLEKTLYYYDLPGLAVSVGHEDKTYHKTLGYKNYVTKEPLTESHIFHMASVTKLFVGTSILQLWENGLLELDEKLITYLPWFEMADYRYASITIRQLLSHTSGMPDVKDYHWDKPETDEEALERYVRSDEVKKAYLLWNPDEGRFSYSNMAYEILGILISKLSGKSFEDYVEDNIFKPLEMKNTTLLTFKRDMKEVSSPHMKTEQNQIVIAPHFPYNRAHAPSSTLTSNMTDMDLWARANLKQQILHPSTFKQAWKQHAIVPNNGEAMCLSWFSREQNGYRFYGHEGTDDGFRSSFWICPEVDVFITVCANLTKSPVKKINKQIFDIIRI